MPPVHAFLVVAALLLAAPLAYAQETQQADGPEPVATAQPRMAIPRNEAPRRSEDRPIREAPVRRPEIAVAAPAQAAAAADDQRRAEPRGSRPRGDNRPSGVAVPRSSRPVAQGRPVPRGGTVYRSAPRVYNNYYYPRYSPRYYYPRHLYPYGYGGFGLGYFYYNPYGWGANVYYGNPGYYGGGYYGGGYYGGGYYSRPGYPTGELRLRVEPKHAEVWVDGYFAGYVDDYDGIVQSLTLEEGANHIEIMAPGFETLSFDVRILPGQKITYRGVLRPQP
jgi:hypothetical protein